MPLLIQPLPGASVPGALCPGYANPGFPNAAEYGGYVTLDTPQTIIGTKTFTGPGVTGGGHWLGSVVTDDFTIQPNSGISTSASMFLDNDNGQVWEFFCNSSGEWGVYDKTHGQQPFTLDAGSHSALQLSLSDLTASLNGGYIDIEDNGQGFTNGVGLAINSTATTPENDVAFQLSAHNGANKWQFSVRDTNQGDGTLFGFYQNNGTSWVTVLTITRGCQITLEDGGNFVLGTSTGTQFGTAGGASGQKLGFYGATPVTQPLLATGAGHTVDDVITALQQLGLVRQS